MNERSGTGGGEAGSASGRGTEGALARAARPWRTVLLLCGALWAPSGCSGDAGCNEPCEGDGDCASDFICLAVGMDTNQVCMPEACEECSPRACVVSAPSEGECSFRACM